MYFGNTYYDGGGRAPVGGPNERTFEHELGKLKFQ